MYDLITNDIGALGMPSLTGSSQFNVDNIAVNASGLDLGLPTSIPNGQHQISVSIDDYTTSLPQLTLNPSLLAGLNSLQNLSFDDVLAALESLAQSLVEMGKSKLLGVEIPGVGLSAGELVGFAQNFLDLVQEMKKPENRADALEDLEARLQAGLDQVLSGASPTLNLLFQNQALEFQIDFTRTANTSVDLNLDFGSLGPAANIPGAGSLLEVSSNQTIPFEGSLSFNLDLGIDLSNPADPQPFIDRDSQFGITTKVAASNLDVDVTAAGLLSLFVRGGAIALDVDGGGAGTSPVAFTIGFASGGSQRLFLSDLSTLLNQLEVDLTGGLNLDLPLKFPTPGDDIGSLTVSVPDLKQLLTEILAGQVNSGTVTVSAPDLNSLIGSLDLQTVLKALVQQFDFLFDKLDGALDKVLDFQLPLVGVRLNQLPAFGFLDDLASVGSSALSGELNGSYTFESVRSALENALAGMFPGATVGLNLNGSNEVTYSVSVGDTISETLPLDADLGFGALGLDVSAGLDVDFDWSFNFTIGANLTDGVFFDVTQSPELNINLGMALAPGSLVTGTLGFLELAVTDDPSSPTMLNGSFSIDLVDPGSGAANDGRVTLSELAGLGVNNIDQFVDFQVAGSAAAHLDLELSSDYDLSSLPLAHLPLVGLPKILADLDASWNLNDPTNPTVGFGNIRLDVGSFFSGFASGLLDSVDMALDPIRPVLDVLNRRIPVLSDISAVRSALDRDGDGKVTLLDAAALLGGTVDTRMISSLDYVADLIQSISAVNSATGGNNGFLIPLPNLDLTGQNLSVPGGLDNFQIPASIDANFDLTAAINSLNGQDPAVASAANAFVQQSNQAPSGFSFSLPILKKPSSVMGLLLGRDVDLFKLVLPPLDVHFNLEREFPIFPPINGVFAGSVDLHGDLAFGYDTAGIRQFKDGDYSDPSKLANGFFIYDRVDGAGNPSLEGTDANELTLTATITLGADFDAGLIHAIGSGDITAQIGLDLPDGDQTTLADGRSRFDELADCGLNVSGELTAGLNVRVTLSVPLAPDPTLFKKSIARVTLLDFTAGCVVPTPLATLSGGVLTLNVGTDQDERAAVSAAKDKNGQDVVRVSNVRRSRRFSTCAGQSHRGRLWWRR